MRIKSSGFRYRVAYAAFDRATIWSVSPKRSFNLLVITPGAVWIDQHTVMAEIEGYKRRFPHIDPYERTREEAMRQLNSWLHNIGQALARELAGRRVQKSDQITYTREQMFGGFIDMVKRAHQPASPAIQQAAE